ncbi:MAG: GNAT family N-acetyltransferase [Geminicoccaceae bacterium]
MIRLDWDIGAQPRWQSLLALGRSGLQQGWSYREALRAGGADPVRRGPRCGRCADRLPAARRPAAAGVVGRGVSAARSGLVRPAGGRRCREQAAGGTPPTSAAPSAGLVARDHDGASPAGDHQRLQHLLARSGRRHRGAARPARRRLAASPAAGRTGRLAVRRTADRAAIQWLLDCNEAYRRRAGYRGPSRAFLGRLAEAASAAGELLLLLADRHGDPLAGVMILRHGCSATYEVGYVTPEGRRLLATHLLLWRAVETLAQEGVRWLDLGGIATDRSPGIARFKLGMGGDVATLPGTFLFPG